MSKYDWIKIYAKVQIKGSDLYWIGGSFDKTTSMVVLYTSKLANVKQESSYNTLITCYSDKYDVTLLSEEEAILEMI